MLMLPLTELTADLLNSLIEKIVIHKGETVTRFIFVE